MHSSYPWNFYLLHWLLMLLAWLYYTWYAKFSHNDTVCATCMQSQPHTTSPRPCHTSIPIGITSAYLYVWNQPCSQFPTQLSVSTATDGKLGKTWKWGYAQLVYALSSLHQQNDYTNADRFLYHYWITKKQTRGSFSPTPGGLLGKGFC